MLDPGPCAIRGPVPVQVPTATSTLGAGGEWTDPRLVALTNALAEASRALAVVESDPDAVSQDVAQMVLHEVRDIAVAADAAAKAITDEYDDRLRSPSGDHPVTAPSH